MSILDKHIPFVNAQVGIQEKLAKKYSPTPHRAALHLASATGFKNLLADLQEATKALDDPARQPKPLTLPQQLNLAPSELDGLPEDLVKELNITEADRTDPPSHLDMLERIKHTFPPAAPWWTLCIADTAVVEFRPSGASPSHSYKG